MSGQSNFECEEEYARVIRAYKTLLACVLNIRRGPERDRTVPECDELFDHTLRLKTKVTGTVIALVMVKMPPDFTHPYSASVFIRDILSVQSGAGFLRNEENIVENPDEEKTTEAGPVKTRKKETTCLGMFGRFFY
jgi:hypothetical protein